MTLDELQEGVKRILDAAVEKFNALCEKVGIDPDDPILTDEGDDEDNGDEKGDENTEGEKPTEGEASAQMDANVMPTPNTEANSDVTATAGTPTDASAIPTAHGSATENPTDNVAPNDGNIDIPSDEELEKMKQAQS